MVENKITELSIKILKEKFGNINNILELSRLGVKNMKDVIDLKELIVKKINNELTEFNLISANLYDVGIIFTKKCVEAKICIKLTKEEISENLIGIFNSPNSDFIMFLYGLCTEHNNKCKNMTINPPFYDSDTIKIDEDVLSIYLKVNIY